MNKTEGITSTRVSDKRAKDHFIYKSNLCASRTRTVGETALPTIQPHISAFVFIGSFWL